MPFFLQGQREFSDLEAVIDLKSIAVGVSHPITNELKIVSQSYID